MSEPSPSRRDLPLGVFDSGVGGLTVLRALRDELPRESLVYLGDTARLPYGTKSPATVTRYAIQAATVLMKRGIKLLVVACNTASALALDDLRERFRDLPVIGVVRPGAEAAARASRSGRIAVISTESTAQYGAYEREIRSVRPECEVVSRGCPLLVALAEEGWTRGPIAEAVAREYLGDIFGDGAAGRSGADGGAVARGGGSAAGAPDCLVLGCTHFPTLRETIRGVVGPDVRIVDSAATTAAVVRAELESRNLDASPTHAPTTSLLATDAPERFARVAARFLPDGLVTGEIELVDL